MFVERMGPEAVLNLKKRGVDFKERQVDNQGLYQLFLMDPNGVKIELNFPASEAKGRRAEIMATDLASNDSVVIDSGPVGEGVTRTLSASSFTQSQVLRMPAVRLIWLVILNVAWA